METHELILSFPWRNVFSHFVAQKEAKGFSSLHLNVFVEKGLSVFLNIIWLCVLLCESKWNGHGKRFLRSYFDMNSRLFQFGNRSNIYVRTKSCDLRRESYEMLDLNELQDALVRSWNSFKLNWLRRNNSLEEG